MNAGQENGASVAIAGRVPKVRVVGRINKGDRLVSAGNGVARAASKDESINASQRNWKIQLKLKQQQKKGP